MSLYILTTSQKERKSGERERREERKEGQREEERWRDEGWLGRGSGCHFLTRTLFCSSCLSESRSRQVSCALPLPAREALSSWSMPVSKLVPAS